MSNKIDEAYIGKNLIYASRNFNLVMRLDEWAIGKEVGIILNGEPYKFTPESEIVEFRLPGLTNCYSMFYISSTGDTDDGLSLTKYKFVNEIIQMPDMSDNVNCESMFDNYEAIHPAYYEDMEIDDIENWNMSNVETMKWMFYNSYVSANSLSKISNWNVSKCKIFASMFGDNYRLPETFDLSNWNVSSGEDFRQMFADTPLYNTDQFSYPQNRYDLDLHNWKFKDGANMGGIFIYCQAFNINVDGWDLSNVSDDTFTFYGTGVNARGSYRSPAVHLIGEITGIKSDVDLSNSVLDEQSAKMLYNALQYVDESKTFTYNFDYFSEEEIALAGEKGYTMVKA